jgi:hypothetical protein
MNIKTKTIIDYKLFKAFFIFKKLRSGSFISFFVLNTFLFLINTLLLFVNNESIIRILLIYFVIVFVVTIYIAFNYIRLQSTFSFEASRIGQIISYHFTEDYFKVNFEKSTNESYALVKYEDLEKVYEFRNHLYLITNKDVTYIITKGVYDGGSDKILIDFFKKIIGLKYIKK